MRYSAGMSTSSATQEYSSTTGDTLLLLFMALVYLERATLASKLRPRVSAQRHICEILYPVFG